jgi:iron complex outermembrane receptor protein
MRVCRYLLFITRLALPLAAQTTGVVRGLVRMDATSEPVHGATIAIVQLRRTVESNDEGVYEFRNVPPGAYDLTIHMDAFSDERQRVLVAAGETVTADFRLKLSVVRQQITVTASGREESTFDTFQAVSSLDSLELSEKTAPSIGEVLDRQPGVAKRSSGPGAARPVIRGFDGDRVLVLQDGIRTGALSSQSGDHGEPIDASTLDRLEVVKGPATLLYGSNALGGVVNAVTRHHAAHEHPHEGLRGFLSGAGGSANNQAGGSGGFEYGRKHWLLWGSGSGQRTGDYSTPLGRIENSGARLANSQGGLGHYGERTFFNLGYGFDDGRYGIPEASDIALRRHNLRFNGGVKDLNSWLDQFRLSLSFADYAHNELEPSGEVGTRLENKQFVYRGVFEQKQVQRLSGSFGFWGMHRHYKATGEEALAPPVKQDAFAAFGLEEVDLEWLRLQFGARLEHNRYHPEGLRERGFTGFSGSAGVHVPLWKGGAFVANFIDSYRAPALEELYNHGPHPGNLTFEVGDAALGRERSHGVDFSLRHSAGRLRAEANLYRYDIDNFVYLAPTGEVEDDLLVAEYRQGDTRYTGAEANLDLGVHPNVWVHLGMDYVDAQLKQSNTPLPRIPPLRGRIGAEARWKGFALKLEVALAAAQHQIFRTETRTAGYTVFHLGGSYTLARQHFVQVFSVQAFNLGDRLYRNHLSFLKEIAPEIGRGVRFTYTIRFF